jgi:protein-S-isoprenylcysteine O-methyltransferase Ste14
MTPFKSLLFFIFVPGLLLGYIPYTLSLTDTPLFDIGFFRYLAIPFWLVGGSAMTWCFWNFTINGRGTPAPFDPPKELVAVGLYRYVRNPMYVAGTLFLLGWALWSPALSLLFSPVIFWGAAHLFVTLYEEPTLKKKFGAAYDEYCSRVPRWIPQSWSVTLQA